MNQMLTLMSLAISTFLLFASHRAKNKMHRVEVKLSSGRNRNARPREDKIENKDVRMLATTLAALF
jgi:hypothetical protein